MGKPYCGKCRKPKSLCKCGRPTVMTPDVLSKLEEAFKYAYTDKMAALYAGISVQAMYEYQKEHPEFAERKAMLKETPSLHAQKELVDGIKGNIAQARWWAEHRMEEFAPKQKHEHSGKIETEDKGAIDAIKEVTKEYEAKLFAMFTAPKEKKKV